MFYCVFCCSWLVVSFIIRMIMKIMRMMVEVLWYWKRLKVIFSFWLMLLVFMRLSIIDEWIVFLSVNCEVLIKDGMILGMMVLESIEKCFVLVENRVFCGFLLVFLIVLVKK